MKIGIEDNKLVMELDTPMQDFIMVSLLAYAIISTFPKKKKSKKSIKLKKLKKR